MSNLISLHHLLDTLAVLYILKILSISLQESFTRAKKWVQELQSQGDFLLILLRFSYYFQLVWVLTIFWCVVGNTNCIMALAGNKADLLEARKVSAEVCICFQHSITCFRKKTSTCRSHFQINFRSSLNRTLFIIHCTTNLLCCMIDFTRVLPLLWLFREEMNG